MARPRSLADRATYRIVELTELLSCTKATVVILTVPENLCHLWECNLWRFYCTSHKRNWWPVESLDEIVLEEKVGGASSSQIDKHCFTQTSHRIPCYLMRLSINNLNLTLHGSSYTSRCAQWTIISVSTLTLAMRG